MFFSHDRRAPTWVLPEVNAASRTEPFRRTLRFEGQIESAVENIVDRGHFSVVHGFRDVGPPTVCLEQETMRCQFDFRMVAPLGRCSLSAGLDARIYGLGLSVLDLSLPALGTGYRLFVHPTPVEHRVFDLTFAVSATLPMNRRHALLQIPDALLDRLLMWSILRDARKDGPIWAGLSRKTAPRLVPGDGPVLQFRRYARQFYPAPPAG